MKMADRTALCNQPKAFALDLDDDQSCYMLCTSDANPPDFIRMLSNLHSKYEFTIW